MSNQYTSTTGSRRLNEFVPSYVPKSDYLPTRVIDSNQNEANQWLSSYDRQKRDGQVYTQRPAEFNPSRYVSVKTSENVFVNKPISESEFNSRVRRY